MERWVDQWQAHYQSIYGLSHWDIEVIVSDDGEEEAKGSTYVWPEYERAEITLYCENLANQEELLATMLHELEHILHAPFQLYAEMAEKFIPERFRSAMAVKFLQCGELTRANIGRLRKNLMGGDDGFL